MQANTISHQFPQILAWLQSYNHNPLASKKKITSISTYRPVLLHEVHGNIATRGEDTQMIDIMIAWQMAYRDFQITIDPKPRSVACHLLQNIQSHQFCQMMKIVHSNHK